MKKVKRDDKRAPLLILVLILLGLLVITACNKQTKPEKVKEEDKVIVDTNLNNIPDLYEALSSQIDDYLSTKFQGTVCVEISDDLVIRKGYGLADYEKNIPNNEDTVYEIGSITKQFTAICIMQLEEKGLLSTEDTLEKYLPELSCASEITIKQLLTMSSGLQDYLDIIDKDEELVTDFFVHPHDLYHKGISREVKPEEILNLMKEEGLVSTPGSTFQYINTNYFFLGLIIDRITGMSYEEYIAENIFQPLNMSHTSLDTDNTTAVGYTYLDGEPATMVAMHPTYTYACGGIRSTSKDLMKWANAVLSKQLISEESWNEVFDRGSFGYGYGWYIAGNQYFHGGATYGFNSYLSIWPEDNIKVVVLSNKDGYDATTNAQGVESLITHYLSSMQK